MEWKYDHGWRKRRAAGVSASLGVVAWFWLAASAGAEAGRFVVPGPRGEVGEEFAYWDWFEADAGGNNFGMGNAPGLLGGEDEVGNGSTLSGGVRLVQTGTPTAFVTGSGAIYSFSEATAFRVEYDVTGTEPVTSVVFQTLTGGRRLELDGIRLQYEVAGGGTEEMAPSLKALDDPQTGAFSERLVSAFQWDLSGREVRTFRLVFVAPGSSMPLWEAQLDVTRGGVFVPVLGYVLRGGALPGVRHGVAGKVVKLLAEGEESRFHLPGAVVPLRASATAGFSPVGWLHAGVISETAELVVTLGSEDTEASAIFAPLDYATWRTYWFDHANAVLGTPADYLNDAVSGPSADPDGDGSDNTAEFAFGGDPYTADAWVRAGEAGQSDGALTLTYRRPASVLAKVDYELQRSDTLRDWQSEEEVVVNRTLESDGYWRVSVRAAASQGSEPPRFLRIQARLLP